MKKILLFISLFLILTNVQAKNNEGKLYEEYWSTSGVNVFAESSTGTMDYNGWMIKSTENNKIYYCIEPETYMQNKEDAITNSHTIYDGKENIINNSRLTNSTYKRINLLAYYGYGYNNHTNKKWYGITQTLIWKALRPSIKWEFKTSRYGDINNNLYTKEISELENLVKNHDKKPSFDKTNKTIILNEIIQLEDKNNVINNYEIKQNNNNIKISKQNNKLVIKALSEGTTKITLTKKSNTGSNFTLFSGGDLQDIITRGKVDDVVSTFTIKIETKEVTLNKIDGDTKKQIPQGDASLLGATYGIYNSNNEKIDTIVFDKTLTKTINLSYGKYYIKELVAPPGYKLDEKTYEINIDSNTKDLTLNLEDYVIKATYKILKTKGGSGEKLTPEPFAEFLITNKDKSIEKKITTDENGYAYINLPYGKYLVTQIKGEEGYEFIESYTINITKEGIIEDHLENLKLSKLIFTKIDKKSKKKLANTKIAIYKEDNTLFFEGITNNQGILEIENIPIGKYYIKELIAPSGYIINLKKEYFEVTKNGNVLKKTMTNEKFDMPDTFKNNTENISPLIGLLSLILATSLIGIEHVKKHNH